MENGEWGMENGEWRMVFQWAGVRDALPAPDGAELPALLLELLPLAGDGDFCGALATGCGIALGTGAGGLDGV